MDPEAIRQWDDFKRRFLKPESVPVVLIVIVSGSLANRYAGDAGVMFWVSWVIFGVLIGLIENKVRSDARAKARLTTLLPPDFFKIGSNDTPAFRCAIIVCISIAFWLFNLILLGLGAGVAEGLKALGRARFEFYLGYLLDAIFGSIAIFACGGAIWVWVVAFKKSGFGYGMACVIIPGYVWYYALRHQDARELTGSAWRLWRVCFPIVFILFWYLWLKALSAPS